MTYGMWALVLALIGMVWAMLRFHVEPLIILALLVCVSMALVLGSIWIDCLRDGVRSDVEELKLSHIELQKNLKHCEQRISDLENV